MILAIDVGNTNTVLGFYEKEVLVYSHRFTTKSKVTSDELKTKFFNILNFAKIDKDKIKAVIIASVVPNLNKVYSDLFADGFACECYFVKDYIEKFPLKINIQNIEELGDDRIINSLAAYRKFQENVIILDFGTAITFDVVTSESGYVGGVIYPGISLASEYLAVATAKLPKVELKVTEEVTGKNTIHAIESGIYNGYMAMIEGLLNRLKQEHGEDFKIIATGGMGEFFYIISRL
jgi:pantothenate kinase, type III